MTSKILKLALVILVGAAGCSESNPEQIAKPYVTNAEYVLERIELGETSGVAFQVKPIRSTACKHMYIEIGRKNSDGKWDKTNTIYPGKDNRNDFGQNNLEDQIHFAEVDGDGEFGVLALGCEPYGGELQVAKGFLASFDVEFGKLNYIGELALLPVGSGPRNFYNIEVADRSKFALEQIRSQLPALETHFHPNMMEKYVVKITPEIQARIDEISDRKKQFDKNLANAKLTIAARNLLSKDLRKAEEVLDLWDEKNGYPQKDLSYKQLADREILLRKSGRLMIKINKYDDWIKRDIPFSITQKYIKLEAAAKRAADNKNAKFPNKMSIAKLKTVMDTPEYKRLSDTSWKADTALREFAELHGL